MRSVTMIFLMVLLTLGLAAEHNTTQLMNEGLKAEMQKDWPEAISLYRRIVKEEPKREDIWLRMADIYAAQKDINGMIDALSHAVKIKPDNTVLYSRLASAYAVKKDSKNAYEAIKKALEIDPSNRDYLSRYALLAEENKDWDSAVSAYRKLLQNDPERADIWKRIRDIEAVRKNLPGVIEALQKQIALEPGNAALYYELARAYSMNKQTTKALSAIKKAVALDPENETYIRMEADLAEWSGEPKSRLDAYAALLKKDPSNADVWLDRARTLVPLSRYRDAIDSYRHYLSLKPSDLKVWLELAYVQKSHMSTASAVKSLEKAIRLNGLIHHRGVGKKRALPDVDIPILEYHCVGKGYKDRYHIDPAEFDRQMRVLREKGYKSITVSELYDALYGQKKLPEKPVVLTFDDGCRESYSTIYPILKKHGMKGEFYLITYLVAESEAQRQQRVRSSAIRGEGKHTSGYLLWNEVRKMAKGGMAFGSHTATHIDMQEANLNEAAYQLLYSKIAMKRYGGIDVTDFSYPYGKGAFRTAIHRLLRKYGYLTAVAAHGGIEKSGSLQAYNIRRIEIYGADTSHPGVSVHAAATSPESFFAKIAPSEAETYYARAEWYTGIEGKQKLAEEAIGKAVALEPDNPRFLALQAEIAAWSENPAVAAIALQRLQQINPSDETLLKLAQTESWANELDVAAEHYTSYLQKYPKDQKVLMDYSDVQSWRGNYSDALQHLDLYRKYFGEDRKYLESMSSALAWAQRPTRAFVPIGTLLAKDPDNYNAHFAKTVALHYAREPLAAIEELDKVKTLRPDSNDTKLLEKFIMTQHRSNVSADFRYYRDSDEIDIRTVYLKGEYVVDPLTHVFGGVGGDRLYADIGSSYETTTGDTSIDHKRAWIGVRHRFTAEYEAEAYIGVAKADNNSEFIYSASLLWQPTDTFVAKFIHDYGYYLISPKAVSLDIMKRTTRAEMVWYPSLENQVKLNLDYSTFSDGNDRWGTIAEVIHQIDRRQYWNFDLGVSAILYGFSDDFDHGYYDPEWSQTYFLTGYAYWKISPEDGVSFSLSLGTTKDDRMDKFEFASSFNVEGTFGMYSDWMLVVRGGYDYNVQQRAGAYDGAVIGFSIMRRF